MPCHGTATICVLLSILCVCVDAPDRIPLENITHELVGFTAIRVYWYSPFDNYDTIIDFKIRYAPGDFPNPDAIEYTLKTATSSPYTIRNLPANTRHLISVAGRNNVGIGEYSADISASTVTPG